MRTFVVSQNLADKGTGNVDNSFTETKVEQDVRYDLAFQADYYTIGHDGSLCFWHLTDLEAKGISFKGKPYMVASLRADQWEAVYDATDCEAW